MYCRKCGKIIADDAAFCGYCGTPIAVDTADFDVPEVTSEIEEPSPAWSTASDEIAAPESESEESVPKKLFEEFEWNVNDYPDTYSHEKTEDIDFDWNADPRDIRDQYAESGPAPAVSLAPAVGVEEPVIAAGSEPEEMNPVDRINNFYTFNRKNEEFQQLLNREYQKVKAGSAIGEELTEADHLADERFDSREPDTSMDAFFEREGVVKPYEPKPFETDILDRIEAQEEAREIKRREEEARQAALEQARREAEEKMKAEEARLRAEEEARAKAAEEARIKAEEEARLRAEEEARIRAEEAFREAERLKEEARLRAEEVARFKAEEEARAKAAEEARLKAEEEARLRAEEEARLRAEEEARLKAEEEARAIAEAKAREEARLKEEADLRAAREAEKIKTQKDARMAIEVKERERAEQERRRIEEARIRAKLDQEQANLTRQAENAVVAQEARKVLEQTARMREAEAAKIKAAIAGIKGEITSKSGQEKPPVVEPAQPKAAEPAIPSGADGPQTARVDASTIPPGSRKPSVPESARLFFPEAAPEPRVPEPVQFANTVAIQRGDVEIEKAQQATRDRITKMAQAREDFFADFEQEKPSTGRETMLKSDSDLTKTRSIDKAAILAGMESTRKIAKEEIAAEKEARKAPVKPAAPAAPAEPVKPVVPAEPKPMEIREEKDTVEDLLSQFESANHLPIGEEDFKGHAEPEIAQPVIEPVTKIVEEPLGAPFAEPAAAEEPVPILVEEPEAAAMPEIPEEGFAVKEEPSIEPDEVASETVKPGLDDTLVVPESELAAQQGFVSDFDSYGEEEAAQLRAQQEAAAEGFFAGEEEAQEEETEEGMVREKGGAGRLILKIILIILVIIFALEIAGIGIKYLAPQSRATEVIDNQLNNIIHLITGEETIQSDDIMFS